MAELPLADRPNVILPAPPESHLDAIDRALSLGDEAARRDAVGKLVAAHPRSLAGWASLAPMGRDPIERYAFARVGYHRGLDALRGNGWGGNGWCKWEHPTNRPFLICLALLARAAGEIGEVDEVTRIAGFLRELDPAWNDDNV